MILKKCTAYAELAVFGVRRRHIFATQKRRQPVGYAAQAGTFSLLHVSFCY